MSCRAMSDISPLAVSEPSPKQTRKAERLLETRTLEPWERDRALMDVVEGYTDLLELPDRKTRFALIIMGLLNAVNFLLVARSDVFGVTAWTIGRALAIYAAVYAFLSLFLFSQAIEALRPRSAKLFRDVEHDRTDDVKRVGTLRSRSTIHRSAVLRRRSMMSTASRCPSGASDTLS